MLSGETQSRTRPCSFYQVFPVWAPAITRDGIQYRGGSLPSWELFALWLFGDFSRKPSEMGVMGQLSRLNERAFVKCLGGSSWPLPFITVLRSRETRLGRAGLITFCVMT